MNELSTVLAGLAKAINPSLGYGEYRCSVALYWLENKSEQTDERIDKLASEVITLTVEINRRLNSLESK